MTNTAPMQADFEAALNTTFVLHLDAENAVELTLVEVRPEAAAPDWEAFSLLFEHRDGPPMAHNTFTITHESLGEFPLFIGAVQTAAGEVLYESVFNHKKHAPPSRAE